MQGYLISDEPVTDFFFFIDENLKPSFKNALYCLSFDYQIDRDLVFGVCQVLNLYGIASHFVNQPDDILNLFFIRFKIEEIEELEIISKLGITFFQMPENSKKGGVKILKSKLEKYESFNSFLNEIHS